MAKSNLRRASVCSHSSPHRCAILEAAFLKQRKFSLAEARYGRVLTLVLLIAIPFYRATFYLTYHDNHMLSYWLVTGAYFLGAIIGFASVRIWPTSSRMGCWLLIMLHYTMFPVDAALSDRSVSYFGSIAVVLGPGLLLRSDFVAALTSVVWFIIPSVTVVYYRFRDVLDDHYGLFPFPIIACTFILALHFEQSWRSRVQSLALRVMARGYSMSILLLANILPRPVAGELLSDKRRDVIADDFSSLSFVFIYMDTTHLQGNLSNEQIGMLTTRACAVIDDLRATTTAMCSIDCMDTFVGLYIAVLGGPGLRARGGPHAFTACRFALAVRREVARQVPVFEGRVRIGLATGPAVGGIIGSKALTYTYYGDTVNAASRMATTAAWGDIQMAPGMHQQLLKENKINSVELSSRGQIQVKGKGSLYVRKLEGLKGSAANSEPGSTVALPVVPRNVNRISHDSSDDDTPLWMPDPDAPASPKAPVGALRLSLASTSESELVPALKMSGVDEQDMQRVRSGSGETHQSNATASGVFLSRRTDVTDFSPPPSAPATGRTAYTARTGISTSRSSRFLTQTGRLRNMADQDMREHLDEMMSPEFLDDMLQGVPNVYPMSRLGEFCDAELEQRFLVAHRASFLPRAAVVLACFLAATVCFLVYSLANLSLSLSDRTALLAVETAGVVCAAVPLVWMYGHERTFLRHAGLIVSLAVVVTCVLCNGVVLFSFHFEGARSLAIVGLGASALYVTGLVRMRVAIPIHLLLVVTCVAVPGLFGAARDHFARDVDETSTTPVVQSAQLLYGVGVVAVYAIMVQRSRRLAYAMELKAEEETRRIDELVMSVLPERVARHMKELEKQGEESSQLQEMVDVREDSAVLATDVVGFTRLASQQKAQEVFAQISSLFDAFDEAVQMTGTEKIGTIGDAWLATVVPPETDSVVKIGDTTAIGDRVMQLIALGERLVTIAESNNLQIRLGIATGSMATGFIGSSSLPAYRAWGIAYDEAQRLESLAHANTIAVDAGVAEILAQRADFRHTLGPSIGADGNIDPAVHLVRFSAGLISPAAPTPLGESNSAAQMQAILRAMD